MNGVLDQLRLVAFIRKKYIQLDLFNISIS